MKKIALSSILFWFLFSVSGIIQAGTYIVGVENLDFLPFESSSHGEYSGYFKELLEKFGAASGNTFIFKPMPVKRLINDQFMNTIDFKIPDNKFWASVFKNLLKKGHKVVYSNPVTIFTEGILLLPANKGTAHPAVAKMTKVRGFTPFPFKRSIAEGSVNFRDAPSTGAVIKLVQKKQVYGGFLNITVAKRYMKEVMRQPDLLVFDSKWPYDKSEISLSTISHPEVINEFNHWMKKHQKWIRKLKKKDNVP